ncbi:hypothetical protein T484DRAFT_1810766, partial [Baffinella frigidus]
APSSPAAGNTEKAAFPRVPQPSTRSPAQEASAQQSFDPERSFASDKSFDPERVSAAP